MNKDLMTIYTLMLNKQGEVVDTHKYNHAYTITVVYKIHRLLPKFRRPNAEKYKENKVAVLLLTPGKNNG